MELISGSLSITLLVIGISTMIIIIRYHRGRESDGGRKKRYHPVAGTVLHHMVHFQRLHHFMAEKAARYGTYRILNLFHTEVYTSDPANVEYILKTNFPNYAKGRYNYEILTGLLGDGIFAVDDQKWHQQRKLSSYELSTKNLRDFSSGVFKTNALKLVSIISQAAASNQAIEIQDWFMKSSMDSVFKVVLGHELDSMSGTYEEGTRFSNAMDEASYVCLYRYADIFWKVKKFLQIGSEAELKKNKQVVDEFVDKLITIKLEQHNQNMKRRDLLSRFIESNERDRNYLKDIALSFILAGKDTSATTLSWFFYMICKHPVVQDKIAREIDQATESVGDNPTVDELATSITEETLDKMQYLHAVLTETLRLYPAVPVDGKSCMSDDTFPDGFSVRKGDMVAYQPYAMGRMKCIWGDDAEEFRPDRWLDDNGHFHPKSSFIFTAFQERIRLQADEDGRVFVVRQLQVQA